MANQWVQGRTFAEVDLRVQFLKVTSILAVDMVQFEESTLQGGYWSFIERGEGEGRRKQSALNHSDVWPALVANIGTCRICYISDSSSKNDLNALHCLKYLFKYVWTAMLFCIFFSEWYMYVYEICALDCAPLSTVKIRICLRIAYNNVHVYVCRNVRNISDIPFTFIGHCEQVWLKYVSPNNEICSKNVLLVSLNKINFSVSKLSEWHFSHYCIRWCTEIFNFKYLVSIFTPIC